MIQHVVIVDFSHIFHVSRSRALDAVSEYDFVDSLMYHFNGKLRTLNQYLETIGINSYDCVFVEDCVPIRKLNLLPSYREGHTNLVNEKSALKTRLVSNGHGLKFCHSNNNEADDAIASLVRLVLENNFRCVICTGDRDLWQLLSDRVSVFNPIKQKMVTMEDVEKAFCCRPIHIPLHKSLWGDAGDNIPNVMPRTQRQLMPIILDTDGRLDTFKTMVSERRYFLTEKCFNMYLENEPAIDRNWQLVKLDDQCELVWE